MSEKLYALTTDVGVLNRGTLVTRRELQTELDTWECDGQWHLAAMTNDSCGIRIGAYRLGDHNEDPPFGFKWHAANAFNYRVVVGERAYRCSDPYIADCGYELMIAHAEAAAEMDARRGYTHHVRTDGGYIYIASECYAYPMFKENRK